MKNSVNAYLRAHHHTALCVENWERSVSFYESLGFVVENDWFWPDGATNHKSLLRFQKVDNCWLELFEYPEGAGALTERFRTAAGSVSAYVLAVRRAEDVDAVYAHALSHGGTPVREPHGEQWTGRRGTLLLRTASVAGPDGEIICFQWDDEGGEAETREEVDPAVRCIKGFHHQLLRVSRLERSVDFYDRLGFELQDIYTEQETGVRFAMLRMEDGSGLLLREESEGRLPTDVERLRTPGGLFQYCFRVDQPEGIDAIYGYCVGLGARERIKPFWHDGYGMKHWEDHPAFVYGPDDEILEFLYIDYKEAQHG